MKVKKIIIASDSPFLTTGYGNLSRRIGEYISKSPGIEVAYYGFSDPRPNMCSEYNGITITNMVFKNKNNFEIVAKEYKPDAIIMLMDPWRTGQFMSTKATKIFVAHIEGEPLPTIINMGSKKINIVSILRKMDFIVPAGPFAKRIITDRLLKVVSKITIDKMMPNIIPDCLDIDVFKPLDGDYKKELFNLSSDIFLIGWFGRMSARKGLPYAIDAFAKTNIKNKMMYIHTPVEDPYGWNVSQLIQDYGIANQVIVNRDVTLKKGDPEELMVKLYNACDITIQPSAGEGFGLTICESMACGNPVIINKYSELERFKDATLAVKPKTFYIETKTNIKRAIADVDIMAVLCKTLATNKKYHGYIAKKAREGVKEFSIEKVGKQWLNFIESHIEGSEIDKKIDPPADLHPTNAPVSDIIIPRIDKSPTKTNATANKPRILGICNHFYPNIIGGGEKVTANIVAGLIDDYDFKVVMDNSGYPENVYRVKDDNYDLGDTEIISLRTDFNNKIDLIIKEFDPQYILVLSFSQSECMKYLLNNYADKLIIYAQLSPRFQVYNDIGFDTFKKCPMIIANSDFVKNEFAKCGIKTSRIYPLIDIKKTIGVNSDKQTYITMMNPQQGKGYKIVKNLIHLIPEKQFMLVGCSMPGVDKEKVLKDMPKWVNFYLKDYVDDIRSVYELSKILLNPSPLPESFGMVNAEAILNKTFLISSNVGALKESGGPSSIYLELKTDIYGWRDAINDVYSANDEKILNINYEYAMDNFGYDKIIGEWKRYLDAK